MKIEVKKEISISEKAISHIRERVQAEFLSVINAHTPPKKTWRLQDSEDRLIATIIAEYEEWTNQTYRE